jgi:hypothetical protein
MLVGPIGNPSLKLSDLGPQATGRIEGRRTPHLIHLQLPDRLGAFGSHGDAEEKGV